MLRDDKRKKQLLCDSRQLRGFLTSLRIPGANHDLTINIGVKSTVANFLWERLDSKNQSQHFLR